MAKKQEVKEEKQEVAVVQSIGTIPSIRVADDATLRELDGVEGAGHSDNVEDRGVPLLYIAQKGSPQIDKKQDKFIAGLEAGYMFNNITGEYFPGEADDEGLEVLPCFHRVTYERWHPDRGGYVGSFPRNTDLLRQAKPWVPPNSTDGKARGDIFELPDGDTLALTHSYYCVLPHNYTTIVVKMASTNLTPARNWQNLIDAIKLEIPGDPPRFVVQPAFWTRFKLKTVYRDSGDHQWYQFKPVLIGPNDDAKLRAFCKSFALACKAGDIKEAAPIQDDNSAVASDSIPV